MSVKTHRWPFYVKFEFNCRFLRQWTPKKGEKPEKTTVFQKAPRPIELHPFSGWWKVQKKIDWSGSGLVQCVFWNGNGRNPIRFKTFAHRKQVLSERDRISFIHLSLFVSSPTRLSSMPRCCTGSVQRMSMISKFSECRFSCIAHTADIEGDRGQLCEKIH